MYSEKSFLAEVNAICEDGETTIVYVREIGDDLIIGMELMDNGKPMWPSIYFNPSKWQVKPSVRADDADIDWWLLDNACDPIQDLCGELIDAETLDEAENFVRTSMESPIGLSFHETLTAA